VPQKVAADLDFVSVHLYPKKGQVKEALDTLAGFAVGKPVLVEETFPLACSAKELEEFIGGSRNTPPAGSASTGASRPRTYAARRTSRTP
jgi:hypothetical protein